ncbi:hypothetical protein E8E12_003010 [Didymella heteroderae]|uniref:Uncharacterized protein n=1 Tax=Didymella heteroderae TaxID=1769908 RepID=A0A9P4WPF8_9PLEO|nr:hypothetical protein E8E12_003010 [Didymella heteroderae]
MKTFYIAAGILAPILSVLAETDCVVGAEYCGWNLADTLGWSTTPMRNDIRSTWQISVDDEQARNFMYRCNNARQARFHASEPSDVLDNNGYVYAT